MGKPDHTQTVGDQEVWYYDCADGTIQVTIDAGMLQMAGILNGQVNDY